MPPHYAPQGAEVVANLTATQMDPAAAEAYLMTLRWERTTFQDTKLLKGGYSIAKSTTYWPEPKEMRPEHKFFGEMWPHWQVRLVSVSALSRPY